MVDIIAVFCLILLRLRTMCLDNDSIAFQSKASLLIIIPEFLPSRVFHKTYINIYIYNIHIY